MKHSMPKTNNKGFIALTSVLIISAVVLAIAVSVSLLAIGEGQASLAQTNGEETLNFVEGCMEDALIKIWASASYAGGTISRPEGTCDITVSAVSTVYTVTATTTDTTYRKSIQAVVTRGTNLTITSWKEN